MFMKTSIVSHIIFVVTFSKKPKFYFITLEKIYFLIKCGRRSLSYGIHFQ